MRENSLVEVYKIVNNIEDSARDKMHKIGSKQIDAVIAMEGLMQAITGSKITDFNNIINMDHRGFLVDIDIKEYFSVNSSTYDNSTTVTLDPTKRSH